MYANLRVIAAVEGRSAEYGASEVRVNADAITVILDAGEKEEELGRLVLNPDADVSLVITADY